VARTPNQRFRRNHCAGLFVVATRVSHAPANSSTNVKRHTGRYMSLIARRSAIASLLQTAATHTATAAGKSVGQKWIDGWNSADEGARLPAANGYPLRLNAPGWFGIANVKWLTHIEVVDRRYAGRFMSREYVTMREVQRDGHTVIWSRGPEWRSVPDRRDGVGAKSDLDG